ncbi:hypothetical protein H310_14521 [Aphanomyces invadans]|uniref:Uncharacterized protein n=1 Tax=Aphanomyces invadans TaxID=157072 RepID=A0A024TBJ4_9STRA|nr:hypothetical protein H310_14521 [Aphanomyces invadans]ETV90732.1 hypothetical protein H310_14521 [Aphanomyces invadans]|eukprot:XP_008880622.1 hypothetical protein H310_14521 [Aphanomyces invadans]
MRCSRCLPPLRVKSTMLVNRVLLVHTSTRTLSAFRRGVDECAKAANVFAGHMGLLEEPSHSRSTGAERAPASAAETPQPADMPTTTSVAEDQEELKREMAEQARVSETHSDMLREASDAMRQQHFKVEELNQKVRRDSERWGLFAEPANQRSAFTTVRAAEAPRQENPYSRRVEVLNRDMVKIVPCVCAYDFGWSFEDFAENEWRDYFLSAREVQVLDLDAVTKAIAALKMDTKIRVTESRVGRQLADFYEKLEQLDVARLVKEEPKQSTVDRETNKAYTSDVR